MDMIDTVAMIAQHREIILAGMVDVGRIELNAHVADFLPQLFVGGHGVKKASTMETVERDLDVRGRTAIDERTHHLSKGIDILCHRLAVDMTTPEDQGRRAKRLGKIDCAGKLSVALRAHFWIGGQVVPAPDTEGRALNTIVFEQVIDL